MDGIDADTAAALAGDFAGIGFTAAALRDAWGEVADDAIARGRREPALRALGARTDPLAVLGRFFVLGTSQPAASIDRALARTGIDGLERLGLARRGGQTAVPAALVRPQSFAATDVLGRTRVHEWWIASDLDEAARGGPLPESHVLGVGAASLTLASLQVPAAGGRVLDVGTGCGIQALHARRTARAVVATDVSARALAFTRLNALLNGVDGISTALGSLFDPVEGDQFDRIVSNPPFVITPRDAGVPAYGYRDGGMAGDDLMAAFIAGAGAHLVPGGIAQLLGNWETRAGRSGLDRAAEWVRRSPVPLDAWIVEREELDPVEYAELWIRDGGTVPGAPGYGELLDTWLDDFAQREVTTIGFGYVLLRRPPDGPPTLARCERIHQHVDLAGLGAHLAQAIDAHDRLSALDDAALAASALLVAADVTEARHHRPGDADPQVIELRQGGGFGRVVAVDPALAAVVGACDGDLPVGALADAVAELLDVDAGALRADLLPRIRELVFTGFLHFG